MAEKFDPYYKWFGIRPEDQPPDFYRLLGVEAFETDLDVISNAADQRMNHLRTLQNGPHAAQSQRILNEVSKARVTLLDAERKLSYDVALRKKIAAAASTARKAATAAATSSAPPSARAPSAADDGLDPLDSLARSDGLSLDLGELDAAVRASRVTGGTAGFGRDRHTAGRGNGLVWASAAVGAAVAMAVVVVALGTLADIDPLGLFAERETEVEDNRSEAKSPGSDSIAGSPSAPENVSGDAKASDERDVVPADANAKPKRDVRRPKTPKPKEAADDVADAPLIDPFAETPPYVALPDVSEMDARKLFSLSGGPNVALEALTLLSHAADLQAGERLDAVADEGSQRPQWRVLLARDETNTSNASAIPLADLWLDDSSLHFQWRAEAAGIPAAAQLRNCLLQISASGKAARIALRKPALLAAPAFDLGTPASLVPIAIDAPPRAETLVLEIGPIDALPRDPTFVDDRRRAAFASSMREKVVVTLAMLDDENRPELAIEPQALRTGLHLRITPTIANSSGGFSLSQSRVAEIRKSYGVRKIRTDKQWNDMRRQITALEKQIEALDKQLFASPLPPVVLQRERARLAGQLSDAETAFEKVDADKAEIDEMLDSMPAVEELIGEYHKKVKLPFRVVAIVGIPNGTTIEVEIVRAVE